MNFLCDQDVYDLTIDFLRSAGHDVLTAEQLGLSEALDSQILQRSTELNRLLITRDRDYGALVFTQSLGAGVVYLRLLHSTINSVHQELQLVLTTYSLEQLAGVLVVVEPGRHRIRRPIPSSSQPSPNDLDGNAEQQT